MHKGDQYADGSLRLALATWVYALHAAGVECEDGTVRGRCDALDASPDAAAADAAGLELVARIAELVGDQTTPAQVAALARRLYGDRARDDLGADDRSTRTSRIRRYQFGRGLPWLARIWERTDKGDVQAAWLLVEQVTDEVRVMDPNPWNDIAEERRLPLGDFQVLWELDGCTSVHLA